MNGYMMYFIYGIIILGVVVYAVYFLKACKCIRNGSKDEDAHVQEHKVIKQTIKLADNRIVDLEIRVKVLEEK